ncbi:FAD dependent oxidoreductase [Fusarium albosuccineum]|uniref:FAD dependent oxidoreductase n=1 Tax=Fusarium albosuccineum TaxID=1237068 RepID=A0A8H4LQJ0_9HYPO|nr:FAD dependent oxidoreductase [Fusarium albosuccineum]
MPVFGLVPIRVMLRVFFFSKEFGNKYGVPPHCTLARYWKPDSQCTFPIVERRIDDPNMKLWDSESAEGSGAALYDDITITHTDTKYFENHYNTYFKSHLCAEPKSEDQKNQVAFPKDESDSPGFRPMYYTYTSKNAKLGSGDAYEPVYQTIFLNKEEQDKWTVDEITAKITKKNWWYPL